MSLKTILILLLAMTAASASAVSAQTKSAKSEKQVAAAVETLRRAMIDGDGATLERIAVDSLTYGHSGGQVDNKAEFVKKFVSGASDFVSIDLTEQTITISGKTAIVRHTLAGNTNDGGNPGTVKIKVMLVWQKLGGKWQMITRQAVKFA